MPDPNKTSINVTHAKTQFANDPDVMQVALENGVHSVMRLEEIPEELQWVPQAVPAILFWHRPLGGGDRVPQLRPDNPEDPSRKYVFPSGAGSVISITKKMQERLNSDSDRHARILIVEGTKQQLFAATYAPEDTVVVGVQGCWGWSSNGQAVASLNDLTNGRSIFVAFDADVSSNPNVYEAAASLEKHLTAFGALSVGFLEIPGGKKVGLDDFISHQPREGRGVIGQLMKSAIPFKKMKKPARRAAAAPSGEEFDFVSELLGEVVVATFESSDRGVKASPGMAHAGEIDGRCVLRVETIMSAAPRIVAINTEKDDLTPGTESKLSYDVELQVGPIDDCQRVLIRDISDADLSKVRTWLARAGELGGLTPLGGAGVLMAGQARIAEAMRAAARVGEIERRTTLLHTGLYRDDRGTVYFLDSAGAHGPDGKVDHITARLGGPAELYEIPGFVNTFSIGDARESARAALEVVDYLDDPTAWICGLSFMFWSLSGAHPDAVLFLTGGHGSGKSTIASALASALGPHWGVGIAPMASVEGSAAYLTDLTNGIHNLVLIIDDARPRSSQRDQQTQDGAIDHIVRVGSGGGGSARGRKVLIDKIWASSLVTHNRPSVIIVGESLPETAPLSTIERCLVVEISRDTSLKPASRGPSGISGFERLGTLSKEGLLRPIVSYFVHRRVVQINSQLKDGHIAGTDSACKTPDDLRMELERHRTELTMQSMSEFWPDNVPATERTRNVTGSFVAGAWVFFTCIRHLETYAVEQLGLAPMFQVGELDEMEVDWQSKIVKAAATHSIVNITGESGAEADLQTLMNAVASGRYCLNSPDPGQTCLGKDVTVDIQGASTWCVALLPKVVSEILGSHGRAERRLSAILVPDSKGSLKRPVDINGKTVRCLVIRASDWNHVADVESSSQDATEEDVSY